MDDFYLSFVVAAYFAAFEFAALFVLGILFHLIFGLVKLSSTRVFSCIVLIILMLDSATRTETIESISADPFRYFARLYVTAALATVAHACSFTFMYRRAVRNAKDADDIE